MDATAGFPKEVELKLDLAPGGAEAVSRMLRLWSAGAEPKVEVLSATYYDTPDLALRDAGIALRVRREGQRWFQTAKTGAPGSLQRFEWEAQTSGAELQLDLLADTPIGKILGADGLDTDGMGAQLRPAFTVEVTRSSWIMAVEGAAVEVSLDRGEVRAGDATSPIEEVELELKSGQASALFALARTLAENTELTVSFISKAERGYALLSGAQTAIKADKTPVRRGMSAAQALQAAVRACLRQLTANSRLLRQGDYDPDALHQARVAIRRLRAVLDLYAPALQDDRAQYLGETLRTLGGTLGEARNMDVFRIKPDDGGQEAEEEGAAGESADLEMLEGLVLKRRAAARAAAVEALRSDHFRSLLLDGVEWLEIGVWLSASPQMDAPVEDLADNILAHQFKQVHKRGRGLRDLDAHHRHRMRIACKKLRYGLEFFAPAARGKARRRQEALVAALKPLQEVLGQLNDIAVAEPFMADLAGTAPPPAAYLAGRLSAAREAKAQALLKRLGDQWNRVQRLQL